MGQTTGIDVKKHDIDETLSPTTRTFAHESRGGRQWACAVRADFTLESDVLTITVKQRVPGRNSDEDAADYYDDEPIALFGSIGGGIGQVKMIAHPVLGPLGATHAAGVYVTPAAGQQHVINIFWPPVGAELVIEAVESANVTLKAVTTWEVP